jgi:hypothetical protein
VIYFAIAALLGVSAIVFARRHPARTLWPALIATVASVGGFLVAMSLGSFLIGLVSVAISIVAVVLLVSFVLTTVGNACPPFRPRRP